MPAPNKSLDTPITDGRLTMFRLINVDGFWLQRLAKKKWARSATSAVLVGRLSRNGAAQITHLSESTREFPAHPRVAWPLTGSHWLACGTAALAFDPLCGDGTGHAIREAILAAAVLRAIQRGANVDELLNHYQARLVAGFKRHLSVCSEFYGSGGLGPWWTAATESIRVGLAWCDHQLSSAGEFRYRLRGFDLERL